jgi:hypothetical protein
VLLNDAGRPGSFGAPQLLSVPFAGDVAVADLNGDGRPDLIIAGSTLMVALQNASPPATFAAPDDAVLRERLRLRLGRRR